jgi:hypothetical protein
MAEEREDPAVAPDETVEPQEPARRGDILGLSDASPDVEIPRATTDRGGNPAGIEVRQATSGTSELHQSKGATGIDMGGAGSGTDIASESTRPASTPRHRVAGE